MDVIKTALFAAKRKEKAEKVEDKPSLVKRNKKNDMLETCHHRNVPDKLFT